jgi:hypothetical protein
MEINHHGVDTSSNDQFLPGCWKMGIPNRMVTQHVTEGITDVSDMVVDIENDSIGGSIGRDPFYVDIGRARQTLLTSLMPKSETMVTCRASISQTSASSNISAPPFEEMQEPRPQ